MPKRRPIFEFKGLSGFLGSSSSDSSYHYRSDHTDESPRRPSVNLSSRYRSPRRHHRRNGKHKSRHKRRKRHYSRRAHYAADQRHRRGRYERKRVMTEDDLREADPALRDRQVRHHDAAHWRVTRFADEDGEAPGQVVESHSSEASRRRQSPGSGSHRSPAHHRGRHLGSPPPFDPHTRAQYRAPSPEYPQGTHLSPERGTGVNQLSPLLSGYPDDYNPADRAVDPRLEHSFNPSGLPEEDDDEERYAGSVPRYSAGHVRRHRSQGRRRRRTHKSGLTRRRRRKRRAAQSKRRDRDDSDDDNRSGGNRGEGSDSEQEQHDENGNLIESSKRGERSKSSSRKRRKSSQEDGKDKKGKKRSIAKIVALALGAVVAGLIAKKIIAKRKKKKAEQEAQAAAEQQEAAGPYGGSGGQLFAGSNPLALPVPKASFSVKVPETEAFIVERSGKYNRRLNPGSNILIPFIDRVAFRYSLKEASMVVPVQQCYSRENVSVMASALLFAKVEDAVATAYGVDDAHRSLMLLAQTCIRKEIARLDLEQMLQDRDGLGDRILGNINRASRPWGIRCTRFEIRDLDIPEEVRMALGRQAQVERQVRTDVLTSQGAREAMKNRADAEMHAQMRMSQARQIDAVNQAIGEAHAISERGEAIAGAMRDVAEVLNEPGGEKAMQMRIAEQYMHSYANAAKNQDHLPPPPNPADMAAAMSNAIGLLNNLGQPGSTVANAHVVPGVGSTKPAPALKEQQGTSYSQSGNETRPPADASSFSAPSPGASSHQASQSHHGTPQVPVGTPPVGPSAQSLPQNAASLPHHTVAVPSSHGSSNISHATPHVQPHQGEYVGPDYPQASPLPKQ